MQLRPEVKIYILITVTLIFQFKIIDIDLCLVVFNSRLCSKFNVKVGRKCPFQIAYFNIIKKLNLPVIVKININNFIDRYLNRRDTYSLTFTCRSGNLDLITKVKFQPQSKVELKLPCIDIRTHMRKFGFESCDLSGPVCPAYIFVKIHVNAGVLCFLRHRQIGVPSVGR